MKIWLDDVRPAPEGWVRALSVRQAINLFLIQDIVRDRVTHVSLDHDLGDEARFGGDGDKLTEWMAEHDTWPSDGLRVHSSNPAGRDTMLRTIDRYGPFEAGYGNTRGSWSD